MLMVLTGSVSALDFDNVLAYEDNDMKVIFENAFGLPLFGSELGTAELKSHTTVDEVLQFGYGSEEVVMYYDFDFNELYENGLGEVTFTDAKTSKEIDKDYSFVYFTGETRQRDVYGKGECSYTQNFTSICLDVVVGKEDYNWEGWVDYNSNDIPKGPIRIGLKTYVGLDDYMDGVWTIVGKEVSKHAFWVSSLNTNLVAYYTLNSTTLDLINGYNGVSQGAGYSAGIISTGLTSGYIEVADQNDFDFTGAFSIGVWYKYSADASQNILITKHESDSPGADNWYLSYTPADNNVKFYDYSGGGREIVGSTSDDLEDASWHQIVVTRDGSNNWVLYVDNVSRDTASVSQDYTNSDQIEFNSFSDGQLSGRSDLDEIGIWKGRAISAAEVGKIWNGGTGNTYSSGDIGTPTITPPANATLEYLIDALSVDFDADEAIDTWTVNDTVDFVIDSNGLLENNTILTTGTYTLNISANDTSNNTGFITYRVVVNEYILNITYPLTSDVKNINVSEDTNITIIFDFQKNGANITDGIKVENVFIGGNLSEVVVTGDVIGQDYYDDFEVNFGHWATNVGTNCADVNAWGQRGSATDSVGTGPQNGGVGGAGTDFIWVETSSSGDGCYNSGDIATVYFDETLDYYLYDDFNINFYYHGFGDDIDHLSLQENSTGSWVELWFIQNTNSDTWVEKDVALSGLSGSGTLRFVYTRNTQGFESDMSLDRINVSYEIYEKEVAYIAGTGWQANVTVPNFPVSLKDLFINITYDAIPTKNDTEVNSINYQDLVAPIITPPANITLEHLVDALGVDFSADEAIDTWVVNDTNNFTINATGYLINNTVLIVDTYVLNISANDSSGNMNFSIYEVVVSSTLLPQLEIIYPTNITYSINVSAINYNIIELNPSMCWYSNNSGDTNYSVQAAGTNFTGITISIEGTNTWTVFCNDTLGNENSTNITFFKDTFSPVLDIITPDRSFIWYGWDRDGNHTILIDLNWTVTDNNLDDCWYSNSTGANITITCGDNVSINLSYGTYDWFVYANDTTSSLGSDNQTTYYAALINNSETGNATSYETRAEIFSVNLTYPSSEFTISAVLNFNGTEYAATRTGAGDIAIFTKTLDMPLVGAGGFNHTYFFNITLNNGTNLYYQTNNTNITVNEITFSHCGAGETVFLNYTFKDAELDIFIDASVPSSDWEFWLGSGVIRDTYAYNSGLDKYNYTFCFNVNETLHMNSEFKFKQDPGFNTKTENFIGDYTNATTTTILYLTGTGNGQYITFQVQDNSGTGISGALMQVERKIAGAWTNVGTGTSDDAGQIVFYMDITLSHRLTITHDEYNTKTLIIRPSQPVYTIILSILGGDPAIYVSQHEGITYNIMPKTGPWLSANTIYNFTFEINANLSNLVYYSMNITQDNGTLINSTSGTINVGETIGVLVNTSEYGRIYGYYYFNVGNGTYLLDPSLWIARDTYVGGTSVMGFINDLLTYETGVEDNFTRLFLMFAALFIGLAFFCSFTGMELSVPGINLFVIFFYVALCSYAGLMTIDFAPYAFVNKYGIFMVTFFITAGYSIGQWSKT